MSAMNRDITARRKYTVGIGSVCVAAGPAEMIAYAIGSCIALCLYDAKTGVGAMAHILLPSCSYTGFENKEIGLSTKYADHALRRALAEMTEKGAQPARVRAAIVGGATMFPHGGVKALEIGKMNADSIRQELEKARVPLDHAVIGGKKSRTVCFNIPGDGFEEQLQVITQALPYA